MPRPRPFASRLFDRLAPGYERHAGVQTEVAARLLERLDGLRFQPRRILEIGCADGRQCQALQARFAKAHVMGLDCSRGMLQQARSRQRWWCGWRRRFSLLRADGAQLPLADGCVDLIYANLSLAWLGDLQAALGEWRRVLRPGGLLLAAVFGPDTLSDWRSRLPPDRQLPALPDVQQVGAMLVQAGFFEPVLDTDWITTVHADQTALIAELRGGGLLPAASAGLAGQARRQIMAALLDRAPVSDPACRAHWEIVSASAWSPDPGQPIRSAAGEVASVPLSAIGIRRRD